MESETRHYIAAEVRAELARQRKHANEVAKVLGGTRGKPAVSRQAVSAKLRGAVVITPDELAALAQWLNVSVAQFFPENVEVVA
jgi:transcriptional regulator with XRE-family HTH domain